jgi:hypothetical protein
MEAFLLEAAKRRDELQRELDQMTRDRDNLERVLEAEVHLLATYGVCDREVWELEPEPAPRVARRVRPAVECRVRKTITEDLLALALSIVKTPSDASGESSTNRVVHRLRVSAETARCALEILEKQGKVEGREERRYGKTYRVWKLAPPKPSSVPPPISPNGRATVGATA